MSGGGEMVASEESCGTKCNHFGQEFPRVFCSKDQLQNTSKNLRKGGRV